MKKKNKTRLMNVKLRGSEVAAFFIILISYVAGCYFYLIFPEQMASHWNAQGDVNGTMPLFWGVFLIPLVSLVLLAIFMIVTRIDPKRENIEKFRKYFDTFIVTLFLFISYVYALIIAWNIGSQFNFMRWFLPSFAVLFWILGTMTAHTEPNWTIGIRTPWTLSSETVWRKTHALVAVLFKIAAVLILVGVAFPNAAIWFILVPILLAALIPAVCSYFWYRAEKKLG